MSKNVGVGHANGKVILSGEHSVVYGHPGLVTGISLGVDVEVFERSSGQLENSFAKHYRPFFDRILNVFNEQYGAGLSGEELGWKVEASLPVGVGLGSSAAAAAATFRALIDFADIEVTDEQLFDLVQASERFAHGTPSGIDATAVVYGGILKFRKDAFGITNKNISTRAFDHKNFWLINTGKPRESTKEMVEVVAQNVRSSEKMAQVLAKIGALTETFISELEHNVFSPEILTQNQKYLEELGIASGSTQQIIRQLKQEGAFVKVTGAGGIKEQSGMLLAFHDDPEKMTSILHNLHLNNYQITFAKH